MRLERPCLHTLRTTLIQMAIEVTMNGNLAEIGMAMVNGDVTLIDESLLSGKVKFHSLPTHDERIEVLYLPPVYLWKHKMSPTNLNNVILP